MSIGINNISSIKKKLEVISSSRKEHDLKIDKLEEKVNDKVIKPSCGEIKIDTLRDDENLYIISQIPGLKKDEVKITLNFDVLTLEGFQKFPLGLISKNLISITEECNWGEFRRRVVLPEDLDITRIKADFVDNILMIKIPIIEKAKMKIIEIS